MCFNQMPHFPDVISISNLIQIRLWEWVSRNKSPGTCKPQLNVINTILHPVFTMAHRDGIIRINPSDGIMSEIKKSNIWEKPKRHALTYEQQKAFMKYTAESPIYNHWLPLFVTLLGTGCRIGEVIGLRWEDVDFEERIISINHNLIYRVQDSGRCEFHITTPKTKTGIRTIPMFDEVYEALIQEEQQQEETGINSSFLMPPYASYILHQVL